MKGTIKSKEDVERLFQEGRRSTSSLMTLLMIQSDQDISGRCAFIAGKKLGPAPFRSRCKRVLREVARELGAPWPGYDVIFMARPRIAYARHEDVVSQAKANLTKMGIL